MPVATATNVQGKVTATNAKCEVRIIHEGDPIEEGEVIKTGESGSIDLELMLGGVASIEAKETVALDSEFLSTVTPEARDNALSGGGDDFNSIMTAIREGTSLDSLLDETAAGLSGGSDAGAANSGGGVGFVMLAGIVEAISPAPASAQDNNLNRGPVASDNAYAAVQALASLQAAAHIAAIQAAAAQQVVAANTADTDAPVITLDPSTGVNAPITGTVTDAGGVVGTVQITATDIATGIATTTTVPVQANGAFSAPAPTDTGTYTVTVTAIDTAGNVSTVGGTADNTVVVDTTAIASITVDTVAGDDIVNAAEAGNTVAITGSVGGDAKPGDIVTLTVGGNTYTGFVASDSTYSISISGSILAANTNIGASVTAVDANGNIATASAAHGYSVDTTAVASITVDAVTGNDVVNAAEAGGTVAITGNVGGDAKPGNTVTLTVGSNTYTGTVAVNGAYSIDVPGAALAENTIIGVSVTAIDANGNTVTATATHGYAVDISAPTVTISTDDGVLTAGEMAHLTFTLSEASDSFTAAAITVSGGTLANFSGSGIRYTADFIPMPNSTAPATVTVTSGSFADAMGNSNEFESTLNMSVNTMVGETLRGGSGRDTLVGGAGDDTLYGEEGKDKLYGGAGDDALYGNEGKDKLYGGAGDDTLHGNEGKDKLYGGAGNDALYGDVGKDTLKGGLGDDLLYGGEGKDIFAWSPEDMGTPGDPAVDTIADFNHQNDRIDLSSLLDGAEVGKRDIGNLLSYINVSKEGGDTVLHISSQGNFENGEYHPGKEDQRIVIENVDLTVQAGSDVDQTKTLLNMLKNDNLNVNSD